MATDYKIIKWRGGLKSDLIVGNLLPREGYICTDTGEFCFCYSAGKVKWYTSKEDIQSLLGSSSEAYTALLQLINDLGEETILTSLLNTQNEINIARGAYPDLGGRLDDFTSHLLNKCYPIGSIYISSTATSPATLFGGTWARLSSGYYMRSGDSYTTGGSSTSGGTAITVEQMPSHSHATLNNSGLRSAEGGTDWKFQSITTEGGNTRATTYVGGGEAHTHDGITPLYYDLYMWRRTA